MARILYGVQGDAHGHAIRALTVARHFPEHEFLFVSYDAGAGLLRREFAVFECPGLETIVRNHRLDAPHTLYKGVNFLLGQRGVIDRILKLADQFKPDVAITDYEFFVPRVCRKIGLPCLSLDNQHIITSCFHPVPVNQLSSYMTTYLVIRSLFTTASHYLVTSFFRPAPSRPSAVVKLAPPLLRERVVQVQPCVGDHVLAYRSHPHSSHFIPFLKSLRRPVSVYGFDMDRRYGNLHFKRHSEEGFLEDLASCGYVVCGGGHTLISEALFYGKPIMSFPIANLFEQYLNAFYVEKLGYGRRLTGYGSEPEVISSFEAQLDVFRQKIAEGVFLGNNEVFSLLDRFIRNKQPAFR